MASLPSTGRPAPAGPAVLLGLSKIDGDPIQTGPAPGSSDLEIIDDPGRATVSGAGQLGAALRLHERRSVDDPGIEARTLDTVDRVAAEAW